MTLRKALSLTLFVLILIIFIWGMLGCRTVKKSRGSEYSHITKDSTSIVEYDQPVSIPEHSVSDSAIDLNELCKELESLKNELRASKSRKEIIYKTDPAGFVRLQAVIDSLGRLITTATQLPIDTTIKGKKTTRVITGSTHKNEEVNVSREGGIFYNVGFIVIALLIAIVLIYVLYRVVKPP